MNPWTNRPEQPGDAPEIRRVLEAAFPTAEEAELVDALRGDEEAWIDGLSQVAVDEDGRIIAQALLTRCFVDGAPALALAPCATVPALQGRGAGSAAIEAVLAAA